MARTYERLSEIVGKLDDHMPRLNTNAQDFIADMAEVNEDDIDDVTGPQWKWLEDLAERFGI